MAKQIEFGIHFSVVGGKVAATDINDIGKAAVSASSQIESAGATISSELNASAKAAHNAASEVSAFARAAGDFKSGAAGIKTSTQETINHFGALEVTSRQTAQAIRMLPAQMTDVVTQLAGGANPLLVLIQQGGQVKDSFGGIGPMFRGIASAISPLTAGVLAAGAAIGEIGAAYYQGSKEAEGYRRELLLTGNAAGTSTQQLADMAREMSQFSGTQGKAAEALTELVGTGRVAAVNLQEFASTSISVEKTLGRSVGEMAKDFGELGRSPLAAADKLNEAYRFMSAATRQQIKELDDQGKIEEAAALAQRTYSQAFAERAREVEANLGLIERGWEKVSGKAKEGWDAIRDVGRPTTIKDKLREISKQLEDNKPEDYNPLNIFGKNPSKSLEEQAAFQELARLQRRGSEVEGVNAARNDARIKFDQGADQFLSRQAQLARDLTKELNLAIAADATLEETQQRLKNVAQNKYEDLYNGGIESQIEAIKRVGAMQDEIAKRGLEQIKSRRDFGVLSEREYLEAVAKMELADFDRRKSALGAELKLTAGKQNSLKEQQAILGQLALLDQQRLTVMEKQADAEARRVKRLQDIGRDTIASQLDEDAAARAGEDARRLASTNAAIKLANDYGKTIADNNALTQLEISLLGQTEDRRNVALEQARIRLDLEKQLLALDALKLDAEEKAARAEQLRNASRSAEAGVAQRVWLDGWKRINDDVGRSLTDSLIRGGKSAVEYLKDYSSTLTLRPIIQQIVSPISGAIASMFAPSVAGATTPSMTSPGAGVGGIMQAGNLISMGQNLWSGFSAGFSSFAQSLQTPSFGVAGMGNGTPTGWVSAEGGVGYSGGMATDGMSFNGAAGSLGGLMIGRTIGQALSGGYAVSGSGNGLVNAGSAIGAIWGPIGSMIGGAIGGAINRAFGRKLTDSGIEGSITGDQFSGNSFDFYKGGLLRSDKTKRSALDPRIENLISGSVVAIHDTFDALGSAIGAGTHLLDGFAHSFRVSTRGMSEQDAQKAITAALGGTSDAMAMAFVDKFRTSVAHTIESTSFLQIGRGGDSGESQMVPYRTDTTEYVAQTRQASQLDPYIDDIVRLFDKQREAVAGMADSEGQVSKFATGIFSLGDALVENAGYLSLFGEAIDFRKLEDSAKRGETVIDTFSRLNTVFSATNALAEMMGRNVETVFGAGMQSTEVRQRLIDQVGGVDALSSASKFFSENFMSSAERMAPLQRSVAAEMERLGYASVTTREQFRQAVQDLVDSGRLATEAGAKTYTGMMRVQASFDAVTDAAEALANTRRGLNIQIMELTGDTSGALAERRAAELAGMDESLRPLQQRIYLLQDEAKATQDTNVVRQTALDNATAGIDTALAAVQRAVDTERKRITAAYNDQVKTLNEQVSSITGSVSKLSSLANSLRSTLDRMRLPSDAATDRAAAQAQIASALAIARAGGVLPDAASLSSALDVVSQPSENLFESFVDYQRDFLLTKINIAELSDIAGSQLTVDDRMLQSLQDQIAQEQQNYESEMTRLDGVLESAQAWTDIFNGIERGVTLSIPEAIAALQANIGTAAAAQAAVATAGGTTATSVTGLYRDILGRAPDSAGAAFWQSAVAANPKPVNELVRDFIGGAMAGGTAQDKINAIAYARSHGIPGFASGGVHAGGWRLVGENGPEIEYTPPSRIYNATQSARMLNGINDDYLRQELMLLRESLERLERLSMKTSTSTANIAEILDRASVGGAIMVEVDS